jgi:hypothetical protein
VQRVTDIMAEISAASQEQASGIEQVNQTIVQMDETTQQNAALVEEASAAARAMEEQARQLDDAVSTFRISLSESPAVTVAARPHHPVIAVEPPQAPPVRRRLPPAARSTAVAVAAVMEAEGNWQEF